MAPPLLVLNNTGTNLHTPRAITAFEPSGITRYSVDDIMGKIRFEFVLSVGRA
jgi:hypothetical protein